MGDRTLHHGWTYYSREAGETVKTAEPPAGKRYVAVLSNETHGMLVCDGRDETRCLIERSVLQAEAECERDLRDRYAATRKMVEEREVSTRERWYAATREVSEARQVVADQIDKLNNLRWWHDKFHDSLAVVIDGAGIALTANPWVAGALLVAGAANALIKGGPQIAAGQGAEPYAIAGSGAFADGVQIYADASGQVVRGMPALSVTIMGRDALSLFSDVQKYPFSSPESVDAVKLIKDFFSRNERNWTEDMFGPTQQNVDGSLDRLIRAMEREQAAQKAYARALEKRELAALGRELSTCIEKVETHLFTGQ